MRDPSLCSLSAGLFSWPSGCPGTPEKISSGEDGGRPHPHQTLHPDGGPLNGSVPGLTYPCFQHSAGVAPEARVTCLQPSHTCDTDSPGQGHLLEAARALSLEMPGVQVAWPVLTGVCGAV